MASPKSNKAPSLPLRRRHHQLLQLLWPDKRLSRRDLQRALGVHPNLIGADIADLLKHRLVCEGDTTARGRGRPSIPVTIDPNARHIIGLAISPDGVQLGKVNLLGHAIGEATSLPFGDSKTLIRRAASALRAKITPDTLMIGVSTTGLVDPQARTLLLSSAIPQGTAELAPLYTAAGETPMVVQNDMHALAARWLLADGAAAKQDVLLILLEDGRIGSAMLIHGSPNQGCAIGANELGHMRFPVATPRCYCGQEGCLERIFSTPHLAQRERGSRRTLAEALQQGAKLTPGAREILAQLANGIANAANFVRPHRIVVTGSFANDDRFFKTLSEQIHPLLLSGLSDRLRIECWNSPSLPWSEIAAWVALAKLLEVTH